MNNTKACIFDAYGTLFDVNAACRELSLDVGDKWQDLANLWRLRQVEYDVSDLVSLALVYVNRYAPLARVTIFWEVSPWPSSYFACGSSSCS